KRWKFHSGVDMPGRIGDPIYATGDGTVDEVIITRVRYGYGTQVVIDHGFGYKTRYAHLNKVHVKEGDKISRGQLIADMGNTGVSTSPHLHYEVIYNRSHVNPINYFDRNMSAEAYKSLMSQIQDENYEAE
ncbi:MAG: M23 family metallopeptidase, partial [Alistipes sp.]|nr:M23 family metallopeptidase [Alistipes sp.]